MVKRERLIVMLEHLSLAVVLGIVVMVVLGVSSDAQIYTEELKNSKIYWEIQDISISNIDLSDSGIQMMARNNMDRNIIIRDVILGEHSLLQNGVRINAGEEKLLRSQNLKCSQARGKLLSVRINYVDEEENRIKVFTGDGEKLTLSC